MYVQLVVGFEWDIDKAKSNARKHGVTIEESKTVFEDPMRSPSQMTRPTPSNNDSSGWEWAY
jgi:uncharacterized DUF497 family protein